MASMDDLVSTLGGGMHVGQQANDLKELQAKLTQTLAPANNRPARPIPPTTKIPGPHSDDGPLPPPAPVSSYNDTGVSPSTAAHYLSANKAWSSGFGNSPRQLASAPINNAVPFVGKRETGFAAQATASVAASKRPHHNDVLPSNASPIDTGGFTQDAFRPLFEQKR